MASDLVSRKPEFRNELLAFLPSEEVERLRPHLHRVTLVLNQVLYETGALIEDVYFLEAGLASLIADTGNGHVEVGMTGRDGIVGATVLLEPGALSAYRVVIQAPGCAIRMRAAALREAVEASAALRDRCLRYLQVLMIQGSQSAACNARHELTERLARWLLMTRDRIDTDELPMTQEFLAHMLGARRASVSLVAITLQSLGVIRQARGRITVLDRESLEREACGCYRFTEDNRRRVMGFGHAPSRTRDRRAVSSKLSIKQRVDEVSRQVGWFD
jgi:CRP-like cAMP-binding protein